MTKPKNTRYAIVTLGGVEMRIKAESFDELGQYLMDNYPSRWVDLEPGGDEIDEQEREVTADKAPETESQKAHAKAKGVKHEPDDVVDRTDLSLLDGATPDVLRENEDDAAS